jgi:hypothetical protein
MFLGIDDAQRVLDWFERRGLRERTRRCRETCENERRKKYSERFTRESHFDADATTTVETDRL